MKIFVIAARSSFGDLIIKKVQAAGHIVVGHLADPDKLPCEIARTTPHLLVIQANIEAVGQKLAAMLKVLFPELMMCCLCGELLETNAAWIDQLSADLNREIKPEVPRLYADGSRYVFHDSSFLSISSGKLKRPKQDEGWREACVEQEGQFLLQLQAGRKNHAAAKSYFECLVRQQGGLDQELAYRLVHGSYKALSGSRDLALKWVALLAHYVPDCEREYLPLACTPGPAIDYVHHDVRPEGVYAATLVITAGISPQVSSELSALVSIRLEADQNDRLLGLSLWLYGLAKMLEMAGRAQISLMDSWLDPAAGAQPEDEVVSRDLRRNAGIYRDFYGLGFIVNFPDPLEAILKGFHAGTTRVEHGRRAAPFAEIWHRYQK